MSVFRPTLPPKKGFVEVESLGTRTYAKTTEASTFEVGDIITTVRKDLDDSWLYCNGDTIGENDYPALSNKLGGIPNITSGFSYVDLSQYLSDCFSAIYADGYYVACGYYDDGTIYTSRYIYSTDLVNWTIVDLETISRSTGGWSTARIIKYINGYWIIGGQSAVYTNSLMHYPCFWYGKDITNLTYNRINYNGGTYNCFVQDIIYTTTTRYLMLVNYSNEEYWARITYNELNQDSYTSFGNGQSNYPTKLDGTYGMLCTYNNYPSRYTGSQWLTLTTSYAGSILDVISWNNKPYYLILDRKTSNITNIRLLEGPSSKFMLIKKIADSNQYKANTANMFVIDDKLVIVYVDYSGNAYLSYLDSFEGNITTISIGVGNYQTILKSVASSSEASGKLLIPLKAKLYFNNKSFPLLPAIPDIDVARHYIKAKL